MRKASVPVVLAASWLAASTQSAIPAADVQDPLFESSADPTPSTARGDTPPAESTHYAKLATSRDGKPLRSRPKLRLNLRKEDSMSWVAVQDRAYSLSADREVWVGRLEDEPESRVVLASAGTALSGSVFSTSKGHYQIQSAGAGWHRIVHLSGEQAPGCTSAPGRTEAIRLAGDPAPSEDEDDTEVHPPVLDLLVVYTAAARIGAGGNDGMAALIDTAVAESNLALENSQVPSHFHLVHAEEIDYVETGWLSADLRNLEADDRELDGDQGPVHEVHQLRRQYQADLVCLIVETTEGPLGLGNVMIQVDPDFASHGFCVVQRKYANSYLAFTHELGHLLGCQHDREKATGPGAFPFSYGFRMEVDDVHYRTVMAIPPGLPILHFSNPEVTFHGHPTGISLNSAKSACNAETIRRTARVVSSFSSRLPASDRLSVVLTEPEDGETYEAPGIIECIASVTAGMAALERVDFFENGTLLFTSAAPPFSWAWSGTIPGTYQLWAKVTDIEGGTALSAPVSVRVSGTYPGFDPAGCRPLDDGRFALRIEGVAGQKYQIDASQDLQGWQPIVTNQLTGTMMEEVDSQAAGTPRRYYRLRPMSY